MSLDLEDNRLYLAEAEQVSKQLAIKVGNSQILGISLLHTSLKECPDFLQRSVHPLLALRIHVSEGPVEVVQVHVIELHQPKSLLQL